MPRSRLYVVVLVALVAAIYGPTCWYNFVNIDDYGLIYANPLVTNSSVSYADCFRKFIFTPYYKPLVFFTWKLEYQWLGRWAWHFHLINVCLHLANTFLLFRLGRIIFAKMIPDSATINRYAFFLALLFAVHPLRIESVAWATERKDVLFSFFFLLGWICYFRYLDSRQYRWMLAGALCYLLSGLSKSMGITLAGVLLLTDFWLGYKVTLRTLEKKIPYFVSLVVLLVSFGFISAPQWNVKTRHAEPQYIQQYKVGLPNEQVSSIPYIKQQPLLVQKVLSVSMRACLWLGRHVVPYPLSIIYPHDVYYGLLGKGIFLTPFFIILLGALFWYLRTAKPYLLFGFLFFLLTMSPVLAVTESGQAIFLSDRYTYIPSIGLLVMFLGLLSNVKLGQRYITYVVILWAAIYGTVSLLNVGTWRDSGTLYRQALKISPQSGLASLNLGLYYEGKKQYQQAFEVYTRAIGNNTTFTQVYHNRATIFLLRGDTASAMKDLDKSIALNPGLAYVWITRAGVFADRSMADSALYCLEKAIALDSTKRSAFSMQAQLRYRLQAYDQSLISCKRYQSLNPADPVIINLMGLIYLKTGQHQEALRSFDKAISLNPAEAGFLFNRAEAYRAGGNDSLMRRDRAAARMKGYVPENLFDGSTLPNQ